MRRLTTALALAALVSAAPASAQGTPQAQPPAQGSGQQRPPAGPIKRTADGRPDLTGHFLGQAGGANYGLSQRAGGGLMPRTTGVVVDPPDGKLPMQEWAVKEALSREQPERGYDDPTAHCFVAGVPRSMYTPSPYQILQTPTHVVMLFERMSWRSIPIDPNRQHLPDDIRLWQGDSIGRWEGDTLVIQTRNLNGKTWLNEVGEIVSHAETVVERLTPVDADTITYEATITDPVVYTRPFTIRFPLRRQMDEILEVACHEDNQDLEHLKHVKDEARKNGTLK